MEEPLSQHNSQLQCFNTVQKDCDNGLDLL